MVKRSVVAETKSPIRLTHNPASMTPCCRKLAWDGLVLGYTKSVAKKEITSTRFSDKETEAIISQIRLALDEAARLAMSFHVQIPKRLTRPSTKKSKPYSMLPQTSSLGVVKLGYITGPDPELRVLRGDPNGVIESALRRFFHTPQPVTVILGLV
jgi:hypothetical protein